jgi:hypothetical protein
LVHVVVHHFARRSPFGIWHGQLQVILRRLPGLPIFGAVAAGSGQVRIFGWRFIRAATQPPQKNARVTKLLFEAPVLLGILRGRLQVRRPHGLSQHGVLGPAQIRDVAKVPRFQGTIHTRLGGIWDYSSHSAAVVVQSLPSRCHLNCQRAANSPSSVMALLKCKNVLRVTSPRGCKIGLSNH